MQGRGAAIQAARNPGDGFKSRASRQGRGLESRGETSRIPGSSLFQPSGFSFGAISVSRMSPEIWEATSSSKLIAASFSRRGQVHAAQGGGEVLVPGQLLDGPGRRPSHRQPRGEGVPGDVVELPGTFSPARF